MEAEALAETETAAAAAQDRELEPDRTDLDWLHSGFLPAPHSVATRTLGCWFRIGGFRPSGRNKHFGRPELVGGDTQAAPSLLSPARPARPGPAPPRNGPALSAAPRAVVTSLALAPLLNPCFPGGCS